MLNKKALAASVSAPPKVFVEDVFSTYLYTGTGASQTITNGIDLAGKGGLVWGKVRSPGGTHELTDTVRGANNALNTNNTDAQSTSDLTAFNSNGYNLGYVSGNENFNGRTYVSWTFRKQPKFFDVVTFTATGSSQVITHNLGSTPGMIFFKRTDGASNWLVWNRTLAAQHYLKLNATDASADLGGVWCVPTSTNVTVDIVFGAGQTWVAYFFAHDAGGFGTAGTDNVISCGSLTTTSGLVSVNLGYEAQYVLAKRANAGSNWYIGDVMRGMSQTDFADLDANRSAAEFFFGGQGIIPTATGFDFNSPNFGASGDTYIYMAIRRPMKVPTTGTSVFSNVTRNTTGANATIDATITPVDMMISVDRDAVDGQGPLWFDRLRGATKFVRSNDAETTNSTTLTGFDVQNGYRLGADTSLYGINSSPAKPVVYWNFKRAPKFMDVVCYTGTGSNTTQTHNLGVVPELMIVRRRSTANAWAVYANNDNTDYLVLNTDAATADDNTYWNDTTPTSSVFSIGTNNAVNASGDTYVAYLFATLAGVSKVGSYTGTGTTQTINCGFTAGARFVLIKRTNSTGDWNVWDTARGIVIGNDPYIAINNNNPEVTNTDYVDPASSGFEISSTAPAAINANGGSFIFLAIA